MIYLNYDRKGLDYDKKFDELSRAVNIIHSKFGLDYNEFVGSFYINFYKIKEESRKTISNIKLRFIDVIEGNKNVFKFYKFLERHKTLNEIMDNTRYYEFMKNTHNIYTDEADLYFPLNLFEKEYITEYLNFYGINEFRYLSIYFKSLPNIKVSLCHINTDNPILIIEFKEDIYEIQHISFSECSEFLFFEED